MSRSKPFLRPRQQESKAEGSSRGRAVVRPRGTVAQEVVASSSGGCDGSVGGDDGSVEIWNLVSHGDNRRIPYPEIIHMICL